MSVTELAIGGERYGLTLTRFFNLGRGWTDSFTGQLDISMSGQYHDIVRSTAFLGNSTWSFIDRGGNALFDEGVTLEAAGLGLPPAGYKVTLRDGTEVTYSRLAPPEYYSCPNAPTNGDACHEYYYATNITYPNGLVVKPHYRVFLGTLPVWHVRIQSVTSNAGYQIKFNYQSNSISNTSTTWQPWLTRVSAIAVNNGVEYCEPTADACSFASTWPQVSYSSSANAHTVTDSLTRTTQYSYGSDYFRIRTPASPTDNIQYGTTWVVNPNTTEVEVRVTSVTLGSNTWSYAYSDNWSAGTRIITATDPLSKLTTYNSSSSAQGYQLTSTKDPLNRTTTLTLPCAFFGYRAESIMAPEGNTIVRTCDQRDNVTSTTLQPKAGSGLNNIVTTATFATNCNTNRKTCNQATATIDARLMQTDYEYEPAHGGMLSEKLPAVNGVRSEKRYSYGQFYAFVRNSSGGVVPAATPVWMPTQVAECRTLTLASCAGGADEVVTTFEYASEGTVNRLLVRGKVQTANGVSLRTCSTYDQAGNLISVTTPRAGRSSCP